MCIRLVFPRRMMPEVIIATPMRRALRVLPVCLLVIVRRDDKLSVVHMARSFFRFGFFGFEIGERDVRHGCVWILSIGFG